jgi:uncharacterized protein
MNYQHIIDDTRNYVQRELAADSSGHDWWHIHRVAETSKVIAAVERADIVVCELAALLHDIADEKIAGSKEKGMQKVSEWLNVQRAPEDVCAHVLEIIATMSFNGGQNPPMRTLEGKVVQDADRLDAMGAIGIARTFAYAGSRGHLMHHPDIAPRTSLTKESYRSEKNTAINHFYEKLLKLKDRMNTDYARILAEERHRFMERYLEQFFAEWNAGMLPAPG